ncbi:MAG: S-layer protein, partial [Planctomycetes bacterium]|nr:S-layer protein [Planctomycetota bacterium]
MRCALSILILLLSPGLIAAEPGKLVITPPAIGLHGHLSTQQLLVTTTMDGLLIDLTREADYQPADPALLQSSKDGILSALRSGRTELIIRHGGREARVPVEITRGEEHIPVTFERDVQPVLTKMGCNAGTCHGKQRGQNGFQLSLLGFDH